MRLALAGVSHHRAPLELRERVAVDLDGAATLARELSDAERLETVVLSTCNRTELYVAAEEDEGGLAELADRALLALAGPRLGLAGTGRIPSGGRVGRPPPVPRRSGARLDGPGRGRDSRAGAGCVRGRGTGTAARPGLPDGAPRGSPGSRRDLDRREPGLDPGRRRRARATGLRTSRRPARRARRRRPDERAHGAEPPITRRGRRLRRQPDARASRAARPPAGGDRAVDARGAGRGALRRGHRRLVDGRAGLCALGRRRSPPRCARAEGGRCCSSISRSRGTSIRRSRAIDGCFVYDIDDLEAVVAASLAGRRAEAVQRRAHRRRRRPSASARGTRRSRSSRRSRRSGPVRRRSAPPSWRASRRGSGGCRRASATSSRPSRRRSSTSCCTCRPCA